jgi:hypothetical protein
MPRVITPMKLSACSFLRSFAGLITLHHGAAFGFCRRYFQPPAPFMMAA